MRRDTSDAMVVTNLGVRSYARSPTFSPQGTGPVPMKGPTMAEYPDRFVQSLHDLSRLMVNEETLEDTLQRVVTLACLSLDGCDLASVAVEGPPARAAACTDPAALSIDEAQYAADDGPCLQAFRTRTPVEVPSMAGDDRFPEFSSRAQQHGVASSLALPLVRRDEGRGSLNLYAKRSGAFSAEDRERGSMFAEQA